MTNETYTGADCTGSSGGANRTLTISNTSLTEDSNFLVFVSGLSLAITNEYTVVHALSSTVITFLNSVWDDQQIIVQYTVVGTTSGGSASGDDFASGPLSDLGVEVTRTPVTVVNDNITGQKTYSDGTDETISVVFSNTKKGYPLDKSGITQTADALMFARATQTMNKYDKITHNSREYRVETVDLRKFNGTSMFKRVTLFFIECLYI